jgi:hypothetical protein
LKLLTSKAHANPRLLVFENGVGDRDKPIKLVLSNQDEIVMRLTKG